jgi:hypothetical protein
MTEEDRDAELNDLIRRATEEYDAPVQVPAERRETSKLADFIETGDPRLSKGFWGCEKDTLRGFIQAFKDLAQRETRGQRAGVSFVDGCLITLSRIGRMPSWALMERHMPALSASQMQRGFRVFLQIVADEAARQMIRARDLPDEGEFPWDPHCAGVVFELPLPQEEVMCKLSPFERYATDVVTGGNAHTVLCVMNPRRRVAQLTVAIVRNHRGHVLETDPSVLQETSYVVWDLSRGEPTRVQKRSRLAIDPELYVGDISRTLPRLIRPPVEDKREEEA